MHLCGPLPSWAVMRLTNETDSFTGFSSSWESQAYMPRMDLLHLPGLPFPPGRLEHPGKEKGRRSHDDSSGRTRWDGGGVERGGSTLAGLDDWRSRKEVAASKAIGGLEGIPPRLESGALLWRVAGSQ